jgi:GMP synthase (glutamine-hydrolysing)
VAGARAPATQGKDNPYQRLIQLEAGDRRHLTLTVRTKPMKIGILQTGRSPEELRTKHGDYDAMFRRLLAGHGFEFVTWPVLDGVLPSSVHAAEGWLITGSRFGVYENHAWIPPLEDFLRRAYAAAVPIVGVCFGHQILAQALGGRVEKFVGGWSVGPTAYAVDGASEPTWLLAWHQDQVIEKPADAEVTATSPSCKYAALSYGDRAFTIQPHPEFTPALLADLVAARRSLLPGPVAERALSSLNQDLGSPAIARRIGAFLKRLPAHDTRHVSANHRIARDHDDEGAFSRPG